MTTIDAKTGELVNDVAKPWNELPAEIEELIEKSTNGFMEQGRAMRREFFTGVFQRVATNTKEMRDDLIDELDEEIEYSSEDVAQYINSAINETLAIVSNELPLAEEDRPLTDFYFEIINT